jgi:rare lipoprotein A
VLAVAAMALAACSAGTSSKSISRYDARTGVSASPRVIWDGRPIPKGGGRYKIGAPYKVSGRWYVPQEDRDYDRVGIASWYGADFHGRKTANGEIFDMTALAAAHPTLPLPSYACVTNLENGRTILVRINDRGPYANSRIIDLSRQAASVLGFSTQGLARVRVRYAGLAPLSGDDRHERAFLMSQAWYTGQSAARLAQRDAPRLRPYVVGARFDRP